MIFSFVHYTYTNTMYFPRLNYFYLGTLSVCHSLLFDLTNSATLIPRYLRQYYLFMRITHSKLVFFSDSSLHTKYLLYILSKKKQVR